MPKIFQKQIAVVLVTIIMLLSAWNLAYAATVPTPGTTPPVATGALSGAASIFGKVLGTVGTIAAVVILAKMIASWAVYSSAYVLDMALAWNMNNILTNDLTSSFLYPFWGYLRDVANAFLILILLWIAFGVIFNLEKINSRRLLVRVILVGLFINFSFTLTTTIFALSNALAKPFADQLKKADPAAKIMEITNLHTALQNAGKDVDLVEDAIKKGTAPSPSSYLTPDQKFAENSLPQQVPAESAGIPGIPKANAQVLAAIGCNPGTIAATWGISCIVGVAASWSIISSLWDFMKSFVAGNSEKQGLGSELVSFAVNPIIGTILMLVGAFVMFSLALVFMTRGIVIMFLAVLSPLAFLAAIIPGQEKHWKTWLEKLLNWSFFAPICFFLLLFTFRMGDIIQGRTVNTVKIIEIQGNPPLLFQYLLFMGMLIGTLIIGKYMGIKMAGTALQMGEKYAWKGASAVGGFALGAARGAIMPRLAGYTGRLEERIGKIESPALRGALALPTTGLRKITAAGRKEVAASEKGIKDMTAAEIKRALAQGAFLTRADEMAAVIKLQGMQELAPDKNWSKEEQEKILRRTIDATKAQNGDYKSLLRTNPELARASDVRDELTPEFRREALRKLGLPEMKEDEFAQYAIISKLKPEHIGKNFDPGSLDNPRIREMAFASWGSEQWGALNRLNPAKAKDVVKGLTEFVNVTKNQIEAARASGNLEQAKTLERAKQRANTIIENMDPGQYRFFTMSPARVMGFQLPADHTPPPAIVEENKNRLELRDTRADVRTIENVERLIIQRGDMAADVERLRSIGEDKRATTIEQVNIPRLERTIERMTNSITSALAKDNRIKESIASKDRTQLSTALRQLRLALIDKEEKMGNRRTNA